MAFRPQSIGNSDEQFLLGASSGNWKYRTDVDLTEHVAVGGRRRPQAPNMKSASQIIGRSRCRKAQQRDIVCGVHSSSMSRRKGWKRGSDLGSCRAAALPQRARQVYRRVL